MLVTLHYQRPSQVLELVGEGGEGVLEQVGCLSGWGVLKGAMV